MKVLIRSEGVVITGTTEPARVAAVVARALLEAGVASGAITVIVGSDHVEVAAGLDLRRSAVGPDPIEASLKARWEAACRAA